MPLIRCADCARDISDKASACPHCGAPAERPSGCLRIGGYALAIPIAGVIAFVVWQGIASQDRKPLPAHGSVSARTTDRSPAAQRDRDEFLSKMRAMRIFGDLQCRTGGGTIEVRPAFYALDFKDKQAFASVAFARCFDGSEGFVVLTLRDVKSGRVAGTLDVTRGLQLQ